MGGGPVPGFDGCSVGDRERSEPGGRSGIYCAAGGAGGYCLGDCFPRSQRRDMGQPFFSRIDEVGKAVCLGGCFPISQRRDMGHPFSCGLMLVKRRGCPGLCALVDGEPVAGVDGADVFGAGADEAVVVELLDDMGGPSGDAADGEDGRVEIDVDAEGGVG